MSATSTRRARGSSSSRTTSRTRRSSASGELQHGTVVAGFCVERLIGRGSRAAVYEATQISLGRRVALKVLDDRTLGERVRRLRWPEHPGAVSLFGTGDSEHGPWIAMRLLRGGTLEDRDAPLDRVAEALDAAHAAGIVHGDIAARNILVEDGRAYLSDFGLAPGAASAEADRAALAELVRRHRTRRRSRLRVRAVAAVGLAVVVAVVVVVVASGGDSSSGSVPPVPDGTRPVGSDLAPGGDIDSVDCTGGVPGGASRACTISQRDLGGRPVVVPVDGTITSWAVRGARGTLALQVLSGGTRLLEVNRSGDEVVADGDLHMARARMAVAAGDRVALLVTPGAAVGVRDAAGARTERWVGPLLEPARAPEMGAGTGLDRELLLRVDVRPGALPEMEPLRGRDAARAREGLWVASRDVVVGPDDEARTAVVVVLEGAVAVDLFDGARRLAREPLRGADGRGGLVAAAARGDELSVRWRNPDGAMIGYRVTATADGLSAQRRRG